MEFKNRRFKIFDSTWSIKFEDRYFEGKDDGGTIFGEIDPNTRTIRISLRDINGNPYREDNIRVTVLHELFHAIFFEGQYNSEYNDEPIVEWSAKCINSLLNQHVI